MGLMTIRTIVNAVSTSFSNFDNLKYVPFKVPTITTSKGKVYRAIRTEFPANCSHQTMITFYDSQMESWFYRNIHTGDKSFIFKIYIQGHLHYQVSKSFPKFTRVSKILKEIKDTITEAIQVCPKLWQDNYFTEGNVKCRKIK